MDIGPRSYGAKPDSPNTCPAERSSCATVGGALGCAHGYRCFGAPSYFAPCSCSTAACKDRQRARRHRARLNDRGDSLAE